MKVIKSLGPINLFNKPQDIVEIKFDGLDVKINFELSDGVRTIVLFKEIDFANIMNESIFHLNNKLDVGYSTGWMHEFKDSELFGCTPKNRSIIFWAGDYVVLVGATEIVLEGSEPL